MSCEKLYLSPVVTVDLGEQQIFVRCPIDSGAYICGSQAWALLSKFDGNHTIEQVAKLLEMPIADLQGFVAQQRARLLLDERQHKLANEGVKPAVIEGSSLTTAERLLTALHLRDVDKNQLSQNLDRWKRNTSMLVQRRPYGVELLTPLGCTLNLSSDLWKLFNLVAEAGSIDALPQSAKAVPAIERIIAFFQSERLLLAEDEDLVQTIRSFVFELTGDNEVEEDDFVVVPKYRWTVSPESVVFEAADFAEVTLERNVLSIGPCHSTLPLRSLQKRALHSKMLIHIEHCVAGSVLDTLVPQPVCPDYIVYFRVFGICEEMYRSIAFGEVTHLNQACNEIVSQVDLEIEEMRQLHTAPIIVIAPAAPLLYPESAVRFSKLMHAFSQIEESISNLVEKKKDVLVLSETALVHRHGYFSDDIIHPLGHHAPTGPGSLLFPLDDLQKTAACSIDFYKPEGLTLSISNGILRSIQRHETRDLRGVVLRPDGILWPGSATESTFTERNKVNTWYFTYLVYSGMNEVLKMLSLRGVKIFVVWDAPQELKDQWVPVRTELLLSREEVTVVTSATVRGKLAKESIEPIDCLYISTGADDNPVEGSLSLQASRPELREALFSLPFSPTQKTGRKQGKAPSDQAATRTYDETANVVATILSRRLGVDRNRLESAKTFRALGLQSIDAQSVAIEIEQEIGARFNEAQLIESVLFRFSSLVEASMVAAARARDESLPAQSQAARALFGPHDYDSFTQRTLQRVIQDILSSSHKRWAFKFIDFAATGRHQYVTSHQLLELAMRWALCFQQQGLSPYDRVGLLVSKRSELVPAHLGALIAGAVPSILPVPTAKHTEEEFLSWLRPVVENAGLKFVIVSSDMFTVVKGELHREDQSIKVLRSDLSALPPTQKQIELDELDSRKLALVQHSSGTTGLKKAVGLTHQQVLAQVWHLAQRLALQEDDVVVHWLPLYHDMGFVAGYLLPLLTDTPCVMIDPIVWVANPSIFFEEVTIEGGTISWFPNFAYHHSAGRMAKPNIELDVSSLRLLINCSEPVTIEAHEALHTRLRTAGLHYSALSSSYAMAENVFAVTQSLPGQAPAIMYIDEKLMRNQGIVRSVPSGHGARYMSSGSALPGTRIKITDANGVDLPDRRLGEVLIQGDCILAEYLADGDASKSAIRNGWYHSGDIGFLSAGELFVVGRKNDLIIVAGHNLYPHELEQTLSDAVEELHPGRSVAVGFEDREQGTQRLGILAEVSDDNLSTEEIQLLKQRIREIIEGRFQVVPQLVELFTRGTLKKSTSGKLSRRANYEEFLAGITTPLD